MSTLGFAMICHTALPRAAQVARHWAERDCPVVIHVDRSVARSVQRVPPVARRSRQRAVLQAASLRMGHLVAGGGKPDGERDAAGRVSLGAACLPRVRVLPAAAPGGGAAQLPRRAADDGFHRKRHDQRGRLDRRRPRTPNASSIAFPFSWKRQRLLFDRYVELQRRFGLPRGNCPRGSRRIWAASGGA
jgi:hypothetical protein